jgi:hypothetical protein
MSPLHQTPRIGSLCAAVLALALAACAYSPPPPLAEIAVSAAALSHAAAAGGNEWAASDMRQAREKQTRAEAAMTSKDFALALSLSQEALVDANLAESRALSGKARKAAEVASEDKRVLREELDRKPK